MSISCEDAKKLMAKALKRKATHKEKRELVQHCKKCDVCNALYYNLLDPYPNIEPEVFNKILEENKAVKKRKKILKSIIISFVSVLLVFCILLTSYLLIINGKATFFAEKDYKNAFTYSQKTNEHPSFQQVDRVMQACEKFFNVIGKGCVLLSLRYNPELTYNVEKGYGDCIVIDFSYYRVFSVEGSSGSSFFYNDELSFVCESLKYLRYEKTRSNQNEKN